MLNTTYSSLCGWVTPHEGPAPLCVHVQSRLHGPKQGPAKCKAQRNGVRGSELTVDLPGLPLLSWLPDFQSAFLAVVFICLWDHFGPSLSSLVDSVLQYDRGQNSFASRCRRPWIFIGNTEAGAEAPVLWPPDAESWLTGEDPDAGKDWGQEQKRVTENDMVGWRPQLNEHEFEQAPGHSEGQGGLACCSPWGRRELDTTEWLNSQQHRCPSPCPEGWVALPDYGAWRSDGRRAAYSDLYS